MRHLNRVNKLSRTYSHRHAMLNNLAMSILDKEHVVTTLAKAKAVRGVVERLITHGKTGGVHAIRIAGKIIQDKTILHKLFTDIAPSFKTREGGYTRILKVGERPGDNALKCIIELTGRNGQELALNRKKKKSSEIQADGSSKQDASEEKKDTSDDNNKGSKKVSKVTKEPKEPKAAKPPKAVKESKDK